MEVVWSNKEQLCVQAVPTSKICTCLTKYFYMYCCENIYVRGFFCISFSQYIINPRDHHYFKCTFSQIVDTK
jgi:hypothetical protein